MLHLQDFIQLNLINRISFGNPLVDILLIFVITALFNKFMNQNALSAAIGNLFDKAAGLVSKLMNKKNTKTLKRILEYNVHIGKEGVRSYTEYSGIHLYQDAIFNYIDENIDTICRNINERQLIYSFDRNKAYQKPPNDVWIQLTDTIKCKINKHIEVNNNGGSVDKCHITLVEVIVDNCDDRTQPTIDDFLEGLFNKYLQENTLAYTKNMYMFVPDGKVSSQEAAITCDRYNITSEKTMDLIFHPRKQELVKLVDDFTNKRGKYMIKGYPHKFGLLLHGEPGTGKTSIIRALALHTRRHIVNIQLNKIKTNDTLMKIFFIRDLFPKGEKAVRLDPKHVIFVIEDIDAIGDVVKRRDSGHRKDGKLERSLNNEINDDETPLFMKNALEDALNVMKAETNTHEDKLTLAGILNIIDGIVECPDRFLIMTTNHPDALDPALIRPGRIDRIVHMGNIDKQCAVDMIRHYVGEFTNAELAEFMEIFPDGKYSPAFIETQCLGFNSVRDIINWLKSERD